MSRRTARYRGGHRWPPTGPAPTPPAWNFPRRKFSIEDLSPRLCGWFQERNAALFVTRALLATSTRRDWKPRTEIPRRKVKRVLHRAEKYLTSRKAQYLDQAKHAWTAISTNDRTRLFVAAVGNLMYALNTNMPSYSHDPWGCLEAALAEAQLPKEMLDRIELRVRIRDLTDGQEDQIKDEDVRLACAAACDIGKYEVARQIARRALGFDADLN